MQCLWHFHTVNIALSAWLVNYIIPLVRVRRVLFLRRMPARRNPLTSHHHRDRVVESKRNDCRSSTSRRADDLSAVHTPFEMLLPFPEPRIEQSYLLSSDWIEPPSLSPFETVAHSTSKAKIPFAIRSTSCSGNDMLNFELAEHIFFAGSGSTRNDAAPAHAREFPTVLQSFLMFRVSTARANLAEPPRGALVPCVRVFPDNSALTPEVQSFRYCSVSQLAVCSGAC